MIIVPIVFNALAIALVVASYIKFTEFQSTLGVIYLTGCAAAMSLIIWIITLLVAFS
jgi:hypothetical protein